MFIIIWYWACTPQPSCRTGAVMLGTGYIWNEETDHAFKRLPVWVAKWEEWKEREIEEGPIKYNCFRTHLWTSNDTPEHPLNKVGHLHIIRNSSLVNVFISHKPNTATGISVPKCKWNWSSQIMLTFHKSQTPHCFYPNRAALSLPASFHFCYLHST